MAELLQESLPSPGVALLKINRPEARNALNTALRHEMTARFAALAGREEVRVVVITGDERAFMAGADLKEMRPKGTAEISRTHVRRQWAVLADLPQPLIAAVNGFALGGGCELAMHADIIVAGEGARFGQPEVTVGIMPGGGGTQRLLRAVGKFRAMRMLLTGEPVTGAEAFAMGLASEVVPDAEVLPRALQLAARIAVLPPLAVRRIKEVVLAGHDTGLAAGLMLERRAFDTLFDTDDKAEGMAAFAERRPPVFRGR